MRMMLIRRMFSRSSSRRLLGVLADILWPGTVAVNRCGDRV
jgi:hypothetical protein